MYLGYGLNLKEKETIIIIDLLLTKNKRYFCIFFKQIYANLIAHM